MKKEEIERAIMTPPGVAVSKQKADENGKPYHDVEVAAGPLTWRTVVIPELLGLAMSIGIAIVDAQERIDAKLRQSSRGKKTGGA